MIPTLIAIGRPSSVEVIPAAMWACEQRWYSASGRLKSQSAISTFSIGAWITAVTVERHNMRPLDMGSFRGLRLCTTQSHRGQRFVLPSSEMRQDRFGIKDSGLHKTRKG